MRISKESSQKKNINFAVKHKFRGFYFDAAKNRYYKIVPGQQHLLPPNASTPPERLQPPTFLYEDFRRLSSLTNVCHLVTAWKQAPVHSRGLQKHYQLHVLSNRFQILMSDHANQAVYVCDENDDASSENHTTQSQDLLIKASIDHSKILCKRKYKSRTILLALQDVQCTKTKTTAVTMPVQGCSHICDFNFLSSQVDFGVIGTSICDYNLSQVFLRPRCDGPTFTKDVNGTPWTCASQLSVQKQDENAISYSSESKTLLVKSIEKHFANKSASTKFAEVLALPSRVTSHHFYGRLHFSGMSNGNVAGYDWRGKPKQSVTFKADGKQVSCIRTLTSGTAIITRQHSARDTIRFWDIRNLTKPVFCFVSTDVSSSVSDGQFHIDETETFLSCSNADHVFRIWNISTGQTMLELDHKKSLLDSPLLSGIYSNNWKLFGFKPGIVGLCKNRLAWFPLP